MDYEEIICDANNLSLIHIYTGLFSAILIGVKKFIDSLSEITENGGGILGSFKDILDGVKGSLEAWQSNLKAGTLLKIAGAMAILTAAIVALSLVCLLYTSRCV